MSRGFGTMQRAILAAYDALSTQEPTGWWPCPPGVIAARQLRRAVRQARAPVGYGFNDSFSRALRRLVRQGRLVSVAERGGSPGPWQKNVCFVSRSRLTDTTWKVSCNPLNLRKQFAEGFFRAISINL
jgi:hypothetical protein